MINLYNHLCMRFAIRHARKYSAEEKLRIMLEGLRGEERIVEQCCHGGIRQIVYYKWSKDFLKADKQRLAGDKAG